MFNLTTAFPEVRSLIHQSTWTYQDLTTFFTLVVRAYQEEPHVYKEQWVPYIMGYKDRLPSRHVGTFEYVGNLKQVVGRYPFLKWEFKTRLSSGGVFGDFFNAGLLEYVTGLSLSCVEYPWLFSQPLQDLIEEARRSPHWEHVHSLKVSGFLSLDDALFQILFFCKNEQPWDLQELTLLDTARAQKSHNSLEALLHSPIIQNLERLNLRYFPLDDPDIQFLITTPWTRLKSITIPTPSEHVLYSVEMREVLEAQDFVVIYS